MGVDILARLMALDEEWCTPLMLAVPPLHLWFDISLKSYIFSMG